MTHILLRVQRNAPGRPTTRLLRDTEAETQVTEPEGQVEWALDRRTRGRSAWHGPSPASTPSGGTTWSELLQARPFLNLEKQASLYFRGAHKRLTDSWMSEVVTTDKALSMSLLPAGNASVCSTDRQTDAGQLCESSQRSEATE